MFVLLWCAGDPALIQAAGRSDTAAVRKFLAEGADPNIRGKGNRTALMAAAGSGAADIALLLIGAGADVGAVDSEGQTAAGVARANGRQNIVKILEEARTVSSLREEALVEKFRTLLEPGAPLSDSDFERLRISRSSFLSMEDLQLLYVHPLTEPQIDTLFDDYVRQSNRRYPVAAIFTGASSSHPVIVRRLIELGGHKNPDVRGFTMYLLGKIAADCRSRRVPMPMEREAVAILQKASTDDTFFMYGEAGSDNVANAAKEALQRFSK